MNSALICAVMLGIAVLWSSARLLIDYFATRSALWRILALIVLQFAAAWCLYFMLFPPSRHADAERLIILTAHADSVTFNAGQGRVLALPEARVAAGVERFPDLATALRRYPGISALQIVGEGLPARDLEAARAHSLSFLPAKLPSGFTAYTISERISAGLPWQVQGHVMGIKNARVELINPGNRVVDKVAIDARGDFSLTDSARAAGQAMYRLRVLDDNKKILQSIDVPIVIEQEPPLHLINLAGAPNPEMKYLRRWALDAGVQMQSRIELSPGFYIDDDQVSLSLDNLGKQDLLILDERAWQTMNTNNKQAVLDALRGGMGVLLRITGPLTPAMQNSLRVLGFTISDTPIVQTIHLQQQANDALELPSLTRRALSVQSADAVPLLRDAQGENVALWRALGRGRLAVWWLTDSYRLVLSGNGNRHSQLWSSTTATLARAHAQDAPTQRGTLAWQDERTVFCGLSDNAMVQTPNGDSDNLLIEPRGVNKNCAAYWPSQAGWHALISGAHSLPFYVRKADEAKSLKAGAVHDATLRLAGQAHAATSNARIPVPGSPWPFFAAWLFFSAILWGLERSRLGVSR